MDNRKQVMMLEVEVPGNQHARYEADRHSGKLQLADVIYPPDRFPGDLCVVCNTLTTDSRPLAVLLLGNVSHPVGCQLEARLLGMLEVETEDGERQSLLLAVAARDPHFSGVEGIADLAELRRRQVIQAFRPDGAGTSVTVRWRERRTGEELLQRARQAYRLSQGEQRAPQRIDPAWKPLRRPGKILAEGETEPHTTAEHAFHALPFRFQRYVSRSLGNDERILYRLRRPAIGSALHGSFWRRKRLEEAVFILSTHQIVEVAELMPPDRAGISYGFVARCGPPERLERVTLQVLGSDVVGLRVIWRGSGGTEQVTWEFPAGHQKALERAISLLGTWLPHPGDRRLQRATLPEPPVELPPLTDPATNDPEETRHLAERLAQQLARALVPDEPVLARCLLPAWIKERDVPSVLAVTSHRLLIVAEPTMGAGLEMEIPLHAITSFEFSSTLIRSYLKVFVPESGEVKEYVIGFAKTLSAMNECFLALRQATGVTPINQSNGHEKE